MLSKRDLGRHLGDDSKENPSMVIWCWVKAMALEGEQHWGCALMVAHEMMKMSDSTVGVEL